MTAIARSDVSATLATSGMDFDVVKDRACKILNVSRKELTDGAIAELLGTTRESVWRYRSGRMKPTLESAAEFASRLNITVDELRGAAKPTTPRPTTPPAAPTTPKPPAGPKPKVKG